MMTSAFNALPIRPEFLSALAEMGFETPTPIQAKAIPVLLEGERDVIGLAQTGTGKTGAFGLPLLQEIIPGEKYPQALILCPTRELCLQITRDLMRFSSHLRQIRVAAVYGGASMTQQKRLIQAGAQVIVATPGRLLDLINRKWIQLSCVTRLVLDEADEMLTMGFQDDIEAILSTLPETHRTWVFSATMPPSIVQLTTRYMHDPLEISTDDRKETPRAIAHVCYIIQEKNRYEALKRLVAETRELYALVFCRTRVETRNISEQLFRDGIPADALHGDLSQAQRDTVMRKFRSGTLKILVATDVAARGIDIHGISHVIHYSLPDDLETYTHRSGRTARAGKSGISAVLATPRDRRRLTEIERRLNFKFTQEQVPSGTAICQRQLTEWALSVAETPISAPSEGDLIAAVVASLSHLDKESLIRKMVGLQFSDLIRSYQDAGDINVPLEPDRSRASIKDHHARKLKATRRFFINVGRLDKLNEGALVRLICEKSGIRSHRIGVIDLKREFSFFEIDQRAASRVQHALKNTRLDGRNVTVREVRENRRRAPQRRRDRKNRRLKQKN